MIFGDFPLPSSLPFVLGSNFGRPLPSQGFETTVSAAALPWSVPLSGRGSTRARWFLPPLPPDRFAGSFCMSLSAIIPHPMLLITRGYPFRVRGQFTRK